MDFIANRNIVIIVGPTASGKTKFSVELCQILAKGSIKAEIINADAMQVYKGFNIGKPKDTIVYPHACFYHLFLQITLCERGTAKPVDEMSLIPHHLFDIVDPSEEYNVSLYNRHCNEKIGELYERGVLPLLVGGTNLYIESILRPSIINIDKTALKELEDEYRDYSNESLYEMLSGIDEVRARQLHPNDRKRVLRSLDICKTHKRKFSDIAEEANDGEICFKALVFIVECSPSIHRRRIKERTKEMIKSGILKECQDAHDLSKTHPDIRGIYQSIGYKEMLPLLLDGDEVETNPSEEVLNRCMEILENKTWQYSQRQRTWLRNKIMKDEKLTVHTVNTDGMLRSRVDSIFQILVDGKRPYQHVVKL